MHGAEGVPESELTSVLEAVEVVADWLSRHARLTGRAIGTRRPIGADQLQNAQMRVSGNAGLGSTVGRAIRERHGRQTERSRQFGDLTCSAHRIAVPSGNRALRAGPKANSKQSR